MCLTRGCIVSEVRRVIVLRVGAVVGVVELLGGGADLGTTKVGVEELFVVGEGDCAEESGEDC